MIGAAVEYAVHWVHTQWVTNRVANPTVGGERYAVHWFGPQTRRVIHQVT